MTHKKQISEQGERIRRRVMHFCTRAVNQLARFESNGDVVTRHWASVKDLVHEGLTDVLTDELPEA